MDEGQYEEDQKGPEKPQHSPQLVRNRPQDRVRKQEISLGDDVGRGHYRVRRDEIIGFSKVVRIEKHEAHERSQHDYKPHDVLDRVISVERDLIRVPVDPEGVVPAGGVQEENVQARYGGDQERNQKMKSEEAG